MILKKILIMAFMCLLVVGSSSVTTVTVSAAPKTTAPAASDVSNEKIVTGTKSLVGWATGIVDAIILFSTGVRVAFQMQKIQGADDETDTKPYKARIKSIVQYGVLGLMAASLVGTIIGFYV